MDGFYDFDRREEARVEKRAEGAVPQVGVVAADGILVWAEVFESSEDELLQGQEGMIAGDGPIELFGCAGVVGEILFNEVCNFLGYSVGFESRNWRRRGVFGEGLSVVFVVAP